MSNNPKLILLISGKRKSGKDYIAENLLKRFPTDVCTIVRISEPIKSHYANTFQLDLTQLLSDGAYKEKYRLDMIKWSENVRNDDYGYFCKIACDNALKSSIWIVSDIRRKTDLKWFNENYASKIKTIRINTDNCIREQRGFKFTDGIDNVPSECDLDDIQSWDYSFCNNNSVDAQNTIESICNIIKPYIIII